MNVFEDWSSSELANALMEKDEFWNDCLGHLTEEEQENVKVWEWDRSDLIGYAHDYLEPTD